MEIGDAIATMAAGRPDDLDPEGWFEAAVRIDQANTWHSPHISREIPVIYR